MRRTPVYHKDDKNFRIAAFPGDRWQFQRHDYTKGCKAGLVDGKKVPHNDPWKGLFRVTDWATAKRQLDSFMPPVALSKA
jgi:hypothetical protein